MCYMPKFPYAMTPTTSLSMHKLLSASICVLITLSILIYSINDDKQHCNELLTDTHLERGLYTENCLPATHSRLSAEQCLSGEQVAFIGDSTTRQLYDNLALFLSLRNPSVAKHADKSSGDSARALSIHFKWDPYLNSTDLDTLPRNTFTVLGTGLWYLRYVDIQSWSATVDSVYTRTLPYNSLLLPVLHPEINKLSSERSLTITDDDVDAMNADLSVRRTIPIPFALNDIVSASPNETTDGLHYSPKALHHATQLLLNYWCNNLTPSNNVSCCRPYPSPRPMQFLCLTFLVLVAAAKVVQAAFKPDHPRQYLLTQSSIFAAVLLLAYLTDRSHIFTKSPKQFSLLAVLPLLLMVGGVGYKTATRNQDNTGVLNRAQTDELKGAMQLVILIYHYFNGSKHPQFYIPVRILVASYLLLQGYGNSMYFLKNNQPTIPRYIAVMTRYNILTAVLCHVLDVQYITYYFIPIVTIWYTVLWITFYSYSHFNSNPKLVSIKLLISLALSLAALNIPYLNSAIPYEYKFRLNLDILAPFTGALVAVLIHHSENTQTHRWINTTTISISAVVVVMMIVLDTLVTPIKYTYNQYHTFISPIVVMGCLVLRNCSNAARSHHSTLLAQLGRCSLELFVLQFHLLLAGDSKGTLVLLPYSNKLLNFAAGLALFIPLSIKINEVSTYFVGIVVAFVTPNSSHSSHSSLPLNKSPIPDTTLTTLSKRRQIILIIGTAFVLSFTKLFY
ncbi:hypothetical protein E3P94_01315 [Wallemia ichthyophaga]|nr:hypothetical protein E3P94_01315 [Wallemia ichthyophaga]